MRYYYLIKNTVKYMNVITHEPLHTIIAQNYFNVCKLGQIYHYYYTFRNYE